MAKTYVPTLRIVLAGTHRYISRWQTKLQANLTGPQYTCLVAVLEAIVECLNALGPTPVEP